MIKRPRPHVHPHLGISDDEESSEEDDSDDANSIPRGRNLRGVHSYKDEVKQLGGERSTHDQLLSQFTVYQWQIVGGW